MVMKKTLMSPAFSLEMWNLLQYLKGRKRSLVAIVGAGLMWLVTDEALAALIGGLVIEGLFAVADYFFTEVEN